MCGIVGILRWDGKPINRSVVQSMTDAVAHRGPDGEGFLLRKNLAFGHRRLAIIDPEGGHQPLSNEDGKIWITYNGELYNFRELRRELEAKGHIFRTNSDTETIVHAYEAWGDQCVERFRGMFAFAIADFRRNRLFLARDHLGIKPLFYLYQPGLFAFASEIHPFHKIPELKLKINLPAIDQYLHLRYIPAPNTGFQEIAKLPPAHRVSVSFDGYLREPDEYWRLDFYADESRSASDWAEEVADALSESVDAHLISDVPFGAFLSGGVDSSGVVAFMAKKLKNPVRTFSIGFEEQEFNELAYAEKVAKQWQTEHYTEVIRPQALEILPMLVKHFGEPFGDSSAIPTYYVSQVARKFVPMVLSGDGGDELFLGYRTYPQWLDWLSGEDFKAMPAWKRVLRSLVVQMMPWRYTDTRARIATPENWFYRRQNIRGTYRKMLWRQEYRQAFQEIPDGFSDHLCHARNYEPATMGQYLDVRTFLPDDILRKVDITSMMHGLEVRTPIVDIRMIELAARIPVRFNLLKDASGRWRMKHVLKLALQKYYSEDFLNRPKQGFTVPISKWFGTPNDIRENVYERLTDSNSKLHDYFEPAVLSDLLQRSQSGQKLWMLLFLDEWLHSYSRSIQ